MSSIVFISICSDVTAFNISSASGRLGVMTKALGRSSLIKLCFDSG